MNHSRWLNEKLQDISEKDFIVEASIVIRKIYLTMTLGLFAVEEFVRK